MNDGQGIANFVLDRADEIGVLVTPLSLQKIVYFCHVWYLVKFGKPLIKHSFEAWEYGPVLPYLYREFRDSGADSIASRCMRLDVFSGSKLIADAKLSAEEKEFLWGVVDFYSNLTSGQLVDLTHVEGGPWHQAWHHATKINPGMKIDNELILNFYHSTKWRGQPQ